VRTLALAPAVDGAILLVDDCARMLANAGTADPEAIDLLSAAMARLPSAIVVPPGWGAHRLAAHAGLRLVGAGLADDEDGAWGVPKSLRIRGPAGRVRAGDAAGWREAQLSLPAPWEPSAIVRPLPRGVTAHLPATALGIGGDSAVAVHVPRGSAAVIGPPGAERDAIAARVASAAGERPLVADSAFALAGTAGVRTVVCVRPTARSLREASRDAPRGLIEPAPVPFRVVAIVDDVAMAVQVLPG
jgi:hypothetical protein